MESVSAGIGLFAVAHVIKSILIYAKDVKDFSISQRAFISELNQLHIVLEPLTKRIENQQQTNPNDAWLKAVHSSGLISEAKFLEATLRDISVKLGVPQSGVQNVPTYSGYTRRAVSRLSWPLSGKRDTMDLLARVQRMFVAAQLALSDSLLELNLKMCDDLTRYHKDVLSSHGSINSEIRDIGCTTSRTQKMAHSIQDVVGNLEMISLGVEKNVSLLSQKAHDAFYRRLCDWLQPPDPVLSFETIRTRRHPGTGNWLVKSPLYLDWMQTKNSFLWLHGPMGTGKTILASRVVDHLSSECTEASVAYFFFDFRETKKQSADMMVRSLLVQLASNAPHVVESLLLRHNCGTRTPLRDDFITALREVVSLTTKNTYIVLDALDECSDVKDSRSVLLNMLKSLIEFSLENLHILVTSRDEMDFADSLDHIKTHDVGCPSDDITTDIKSFVTSQLIENSKWSKWPEEDRKLVARKLKDEANGMFRWAVCQLEFLGTCRSRKQLRMAIGTLPPDLGETYHQILSRTDDRDRQVLCLILQLLLFSKREMTLVEVAEIVAAKLGPSGDVLFDSDERWLDVNDIIALCGSLVTVSKSEQKQQVVPDGPVMRLAHLSVKEFLLAAPPIHWYAQNEKLAHEFLVQFCLTYLTCLDWDPLLQLNALPSSLEEDFSKYLRREWPFGYYAALYWSFHYRESISPRVHDCAVNFVLNEFPKLHSIRIASPDSLCHFGQAKPLVMTSTYFAASLGLDDILPYLPLDDKDCQAFFGTPLQAASYHGHHKVVKYLIEMGADINSVSGEYGTALKAASYAGHESIILLLLSSGAQVELSGGQQPGTPLLIATRQGHLKVVELLLDHGADANVEEGSALSLAILESRSGIFELLLDHGANPNANGGQFGTVLGTAISYSLYWPMGYPKTTQTTKMLLDRGAEIKRLDYSVLEIAAYNCDLKLSKLLVESGADLSLGEPLGKALICLQDCRSGKRMLDNVTLEDCWENVKYYLRLSRSPPRERRRGRSLPPRRRLAEEIKIQKQEGVDKKRTIFYSDASGLITANRSKFFVYDPSLQQRIRQTVDLSQTGGRHQGGRDWSFNCWNQWWFDSRVLFVVKDSGQEERYYYNYDITSEKCWLYTTSLKCTAL